MSRATKIVATLGPASSAPDVLERLINAGVDVVRMNFSHGKAEDHIARANLVRELAKKSNRTVGILADLQGPKIRVGRFKDNKVILKTGATFVLDADCVLGDEEQVGIDYKELARDVKSKDVLLLNDGLIVFEVMSVRGNRIECKVLVGGVLSNNKGINRKGGGLTAPPLTSKDMEDIKT
ncbi:MAG: pyruvate kinase, partial [Aeromicrobium sp.]|nr:pyruvate kinase [Burkholderiales bacterium]